MELFISLSCKHRYEYLLSAQLDGPQCAPEGGTCKTGCSRNHICYGVECEQKMVIQGNTIAIHIALTEQFPTPMMNFAIRVLLNSKYVTVRAFSLHPILLKNIFLPCVRGTMLGFFSLSYLVRYYVMRIM